MMQGQSAVDGKHLKSVFVLSREHSIRLVDHLDNANDLSAYANGHAKNVSGGVSGLFVNGCVESRIFVDVMNVDGFSGFGNITSNASSNRKSENRIRNQYKQTNKQMAILPYFFAEIPFGFIICTTQSMFADVEYPRIKLIGLGIDEKERRSIS